MPSYDRLTFDLPDRLGKSLQVSGLSVADMAEYLDVHRNTIGGWLHRRIKPSTQTVRLWALRTGVSYDWIRNGDDAVHPRDAARRDDQVRPGGDAQSSKPVG